MLGPGLHFLHNGLVDILIGNSDAGNEDRGSYLLVKWISGMLQEKGERRRKRNKTHPIKKIRSYTRTL